MTTETRGKYKKIYSREFVDLEEEMGITLEEDKEYIIDVRNRAKICAEDSAPTEGGFPVCNQNFPYTHIGGKLWLKSLGFEPNEVYIYKNFAEEETQSED